MEEAESHTSVPGRMCVFVCVHTGPGRLCVDADSLQSPETEEWVSVSLSQALSVVMKIKINSHLGLSADWLLRYFCPGLHSERYFCRH